MKSGLYLPTPHNILVKTTIIQQMKQNELIRQKLGLESHKEGGYFKQTYKSPLSAGNRSLMTVIYYMVTTESPVTHWHMNKSDIMLFHHQGGRLRYLIIYPEDGRLEQHVLSSNILEESSQLFVPGNTWKACVLQDQEYGLISEAVAPGFEYEDNTMISYEQLLQKFPQHKDLLDQVQAKAVPQN